VRKLTAIVILAIIIIIGIPGSAVVRSEPISDQTPRPTLEAASPKVKAIFADAVRSFNLYSSFLGDYQVKGDCLVPLHGASHREALNYLNNGFTSYMSQAIIDECTLFNDSLGCLVINPSDGIPVLTPQDADKTMVYAEDGNSIVFLRKYNDCYTEGDEYLFLVTMISGDNSWKISDISFMATNENTMKGCDPVAPLRY